jgi:hypothetical protein
MKDREVILRYLAFQIFDYKTDYEGDMSLFLENAMKKINLMSDKEIEELRNYFRFIMDVTYKCFGNTNFRLPTTDKQGNHRRGRINVALLESVAYFFYSKWKEDYEFLLFNSQKIKENFHKLLENPDYLDAIKSGTSSKAKVITRFDLAQQILGEI